MTHSKSIRRPATTKYYCSHSCCTLFRKRLILALSYIIDVSDISTTCSLMKRHFSLLIGYLVGHPISDIIQLQLVYNAS